MQKQESLFTDREKFLMLLLGAINFSHIVDFMIMMPLGPQLMRIFSISPHQFGLLVSCYTFAAAVSSFISSLFIDRFDRKLVLIFFYLGFALATIACALSKTYFFLLLARSLCGIFGGVISSVVFSILSDAINPDRRATAMGLVMISFSIASVIGIPFSLFLANQYDWHSPFMFLGVSSAFLAVLLAMKMPSMKNHLKGPGSPHDPFATLKHIIENPSQIMALAFMFSVVFGQFSMIPFISPSFVANTGLPEGQLPLLYLAGGICSMFGSPFFGRMSDRFGKKQVFAIGAAISILPILLITNLGPTPPWLTLVISSFFFFAMGGRMVPASALMSTATTPRFRGGFMGISASIQQLGSSLASYLAGLVVVKNTEGRLENYNYVGWIAIAFTLLAIALVTKVKAQEIQHH
jgi:predicted MFS family arabinose efflux permease